MIACLLKYARWPADPEDTTQTLHTHRIEVQQPLAKGDTLTWEDDIGVAYGRVFGVHHLVRKDRSFLVVDVALLRPYLRPELDDADVEPVETPQHVMRFCAACREQEGDCHCAFLGKVPQWEAAETTPEPKPEDPVQAMLDRLAPLLPRSFTIRERDGLFEIMHGETVVSSANDPEMAFRGSFVALRNLQNFRDEVQRWAQAGPGGCPPYTSSAAAMLKRLDATFAGLRSVETSLRNQLAAETERRSRAIQQAFAAEPLEEKPQVAPTPGEILDALLVHGFACVLPGDDRPRQLRIPLRLPLRRRRERGRGAGGAVAVQGRDQGPPDGRAVVDRHHDPAQGHRQMSKSYTPAMLKVLRNLRAGRASDWGLEGRSEHGGHFRTLKALRDRGAIEGEPPTVTAVGERALERA